MLANSFTYLPITYNEEGIQKWGLISDYSVAKYLRTDSNTERKKRLAKTVEEVLKKDLDIDEVMTCSPTDTLDKALEQSKGKPVLVMDQDRLVGIVTPFDMV